MQMPTSGPGGASYRPFLAVGAAVTPTPVVIPREVPSEDHSEYLSTVLALREAQGRPDSAAMGSDKAALRHQMGQLTTVKTFLEGSGSELEQAARDRVLANPKKLTVYRSLTSLDDRALFISLEQKAVQAEQKASSNANLGIAVPEGLSSDRAVKYRTLVLLKRDVEPEISSLSPGILRTHLEARLALIEARITALEIKATGSQPDEPTVVI